MKDSEILAEAKPLSVMGPKLLYLLAAARLCEDVPGCVAEVGVYRGGSSVLLCRAFPKRPVHGFDTYNGMPEDDSLIKMGHKKGDFGDTSAKGVNDLMHRLGIQNFHAFAGDFRETKNKVRKIGYAFVHIDCDIYQTAKAAVDFFLPRLQPGGGLFFDDYNSGKCLGITVVADNLFASGKFTQHPSHGTMFLKLK